MTGPAREGGGVIAQHAAGCTSARDAKNPRPDLSDRGFPVMCGLFGQLSDQPVRLLWSGAVYRLRVVLCTGTFGSPVITAI